MDNQKVLLSSRVASVGIPAIEILDLIEQYGLPAAEALIQLLEAGKSTPAGMKVSLSGAAPAPVAWAKAAIVTLLKQYHDQILTTVANVDKQALDALIAALSV
jgi:hypothetical protein